VRRGGKTKKTLRVNRIVTLKGHPEGIKPSSAWKNIDTHSMPDLSGEKQTKKRNASLRNIDLSQGTMWRKEKNEHYLKESLSKKLGLRESDTTRIQNMKKLRSTRNNV